MALFLDMLIYGLVVPRQRAEHLGLRRREQRQLERERQDELPNRERL